MLLLVEKNRAVYSVKLLYDSQYPATFQSILAFAWRLLASVRHPQKLTLYNTILMFGLFNKLRVRALVIGVCQAKQVLRPARSIDLDGFGRSSVFGDPNAS